MKPQPKTFNPSDYPHKTTKSGYRIFENINRSALVFLRVKKCIFINCEMDAADCSKAVFENCAFIGCCMFGTEWPGAKFIKTVRDGLPYPYKFRPGIDFRGYKYSSAQNLKVYSLCPKGDKFEKYQFMDFDPADNSVYVHDSIYHFSRKMSFSLPKKYTDLDAWTQNLKDFCNEECEKNGLDKNSLSWDEQWKIRLKHEEIYGAIL